MRPGRRPARVCLMSRGKSCIMGHREGNMLRLVSVLTLVLLAAPGSAAAESVRIVVDGVFDDWDGVAPVYTDPSGDQTSGEVDFGNIYIVNDENRLHFSLEVGAEVNIQEGNHISIFLDTDNNAATGELRHGIGADMGWTFGNRRGFFVVEPHVLDITHSRIGIVAAPTVTAARFEFCLDREATPVGPYPLFQGDTVRVAIEDADGGDVLPDAGGSIVYVFDDEPLAPWEPAGIRKRGESQVRFLTYNVLFDGIFDSEKRRSFDRVFNAVIPDIVGFEEIYDHTAEETRDLVAGFLPAFGPWYGSKVEPDIIAVSRYPIMGAQSIGTNGAFLIDLGEEHESGVLLIVAHPPCCDNDEGRQLEIDAIMAFVRESKSDGGPLDIAADTPIVIVGDMNLVGDRRQLNTFLTGEIVNTNAYGPWFRPDWDETDLSDARPLHTDAPMAFTWDDAGSSYWPGRLDFIIYSDAVMDLARSFVLSTSEMHEDTLAAFGLLDTDTAVASDHLPVVSDFIIYPGEREPAAKSYAAPNPARNGMTAITFGEQFLGVSKQVTFYDIRGRRVDRAGAGGDDTLLLWDGKNSDGRTVAPGIYLAVITSGPTTETVKVVYLR